MRPPDSNANNPPGGQPDSFGHRRGKLSLANISIPSFASFRPPVVVAQGEPLPSPVRRKPLPANASPISPRYASFNQPRPPVKGGPATQPQRSPHRSFSLDSPIGLADKSLTRNNTRLAPIPSPGDTGLIVRDLDKYVIMYEHGIISKRLIRNPRGTSPRFPEQSSAFPPRKSSLPRNELKATPPRNRVAAVRPVNERTPSGHKKAQVSFSGTVEERRRPSSPTMTTLDTRALTMGRLGDGLTTPVDEREPPTFAIQAPKQKSPGKKALGSFFSWKRTPSLESPTTTFSDRSLSPNASPLPAFRDGSADTKPLPAPLDVRRANAGVQHALLTPSNPTLPLPTPPATTAHVAELERELQEISAELANSIKREMELEDELERYKMEASASSMDANRRTSDYYSDSGISSVRYGESEGKIEELERLRRKAELEKAQTKLEMSQRLEDALRTRREVEERFSSPENKSPKTRELEVLLEKARRQLQEERQCRESYESLIAGMKMELEQHRNERDNLRDEVVPQLRARLDGLENESANVQNLTYENSRLQQELEKVRNEHDTLVNARRMQLEMQKQQERMMGSITEDDGPLSMQPGLSRTMSLAAKTRNRSGSMLSRSGSIRESGGLTRSNSIKGGTNESREELAQRIREVEDQRAALHSTLKSLILRQSQMEKQHAKRLKALEVERDKSMNLTPRRSTFQKEVRNLRDEVIDLRRRADEALEQKWRCENGLSGLKMDLDRAQEETNSLRQLLQERDIFIPERPGSRSGRTLAPGAPGSLDKAYKELRTTHALSIASVMALEAEDSLGIATTEAEKTLELLKKSISDAEAERDMAQKQATQYREEARKLQKSELDHLSKEQSLAAELYASAQRMDDLASQVQTQLHSNSLLRQRLAEAIGRGEQEQKSSAARIAQMQGKLRQLEDKLMTAQHHSEEVVASHEEEVRQLRDAHNAQLKRVKGGSLSPANTAPSSPLNPLFSLKSPRASRAPGAALTMADASRTRYLENKVRELERALGDAEREMEEVVQRMNSAQIEVAELQSERYVRRCARCSAPSFSSTATLVNDEQATGKSNSWFGFANVWVAGTRL